MLIIVIPAFYKHGVTDIRSGGIGGGRSSPFNRTGWYDFRFLVGVCSTFFVISLGAQNHFFSALFSRFLVKFRVFPLLPFILVDISSYSENEYTSR